MNTKTKKKNLETLFFNIWSNLQILERNVCFKVKLYAPQRNKRGKVCKVNEGHSWAQRDGPSGQSCHTVAINELLCMKNAGAQIAMDFS